MIAICGDSFATPDPEYGACWVDLLGQHYDIQNWAEPGASNLMIALQVDAALAQAADYIIVSFTSSTRNQIARRPGATLLDQLQGYSFPAMSNMQDHPDLALLREYHLRFMHLPTQIYENRCIIACVLNKLQRQSRPWIWSPGGFEHPSFGGSGPELDDYADNLSAVNLWDWPHARSYRPYYHITDPARHQYIAQYYANAYEQARNTVPSTMDTHLSKPTN